jgi:hypothetical protein
MRRSPTRRATAGGYRWPSGQTVIADSAVSDVVAAGGYDREAGQYR